MKSRNSKCLLTAANGGTGEHHRQPARGGIGVIRFRADARAGTSLNKVLGWRFAYDGQRECRRGQSHCLDSYTTANSYAYDNPPDSDTRTHHTAHTYDCATTTSTVTAACTYAAAYTYDCATTAPTVTTAIYNHHCA